MSEWKSDGSLIRKTASTINDDRVVSISSTIIQQFNKWSNIKCNEVISLSDTTQFISVYRLCTSTQLDW